VNGRERGVGKSADAAQVGVMFTTSDSGIPKRARKTTTGYHQYNE